MAAKRIPNIGQTTIVIATGKAPARAGRPGGREATVLAAVEKLGRATAHMVFERVRKAGQRTRSAWQDTCWILRGLARQGVVELRRDERAEEESGRVLYMVTKPDRRRAAIDHAVEPDKVLKLIKSGRVLVIR